MQFHILSFEGPDPYVHAGGIASRGDPARGRALRRAGQQTAEGFYWPGVLERSLLPHVQLQTRTQRAA